MNIWDMMFNHAEKKHFIRNFQFIYKLEYKRNKTAFFHQH